MGSAPAGAVRRAVERTQAQGQALRPAAFHTGVPSTSAGGCICLYCANSIIGADEKHEGVGSRAEQGSRTVGRKRGAKAAV